MTTDEEILDKDFGCKCEPDKSGYFCKKCGINLSIRKRAATLMKLVREAERKECEKEMHGLSTARRLAEQVEQQTKRAEKAEADARGLYAQIEAIKEGVASREASQQTKITRLENFVSKLETDIEAELKLAEEYKDKRLCFLLLSIITRIRKLRAEGERVEKAEGERTDQKKTGM